MKFKENTDNPFTKVVRAFLVAVAFAGAIWGYGHSTYAQSSADAHYKTPLPPKNPSAWLTTPWTSSDAPYLAMRKEIAAKIKVGLPVKAALAAERQNAIDHPNDFAAQYRWLYAANLASPNGEDFDNQALAAVASLDPCNIAIVARSRWLSIMQTQQNEDHPALQPLGERLLQFHPQDHTVRLHLIYDLCAGRPGPYSVRPLAKALTMAQIWVKEEPSNPASHSTLGYVWDSYYHALGRRRVYAQKAIDEYKQYLRLAKPGDDFRPGAERIVKGLTQNLPTLN
jgi:hypothetical protein